MTPAPSRRSAMQRMHERWKRMRMRNPAKRGTSRRTAGWLAAGLAALGFAVWMGTKSPKSVSTAPATIERTRAPNRSPGRGPKGFEQLPYTQIPSGEAQESVEKKPPTTPLFPPKKTAGEKDAKKITDQHIVHLSSIGWSGLKPINWKKRIWTPRSGTPFPAELKHNQVVEVAGQTGTGGTSRMYVLVAHHPMRSDLTYILLRPQDRYSGGGTPTQGVETNSLKDMLDYVKIFDDSHRDPQVTGIYGPAD